MQNVLVVLQWCAVVQGHIHGTMFRWSVLQSRCANITADGKVTSIRLG